MSSSKCFCAKPAPPKLQSLGDSTNHGKNDNSAGVSTRHLGTGDMGDLERLVEESGDIGDLERLGTGDMGDWERLVEESGDIGDLGVLLGNAAPNSKCCTWTRVCLAN
eukprot:CAMPEP_0171176578 /NCGR_PEP_ID=MMETSP0790-20130122/11807_1 /TAXON_ID=2925 /ORGANISM="Alexandrium catenella, Strain OF101" /LENGTH=107 /DNA_ID=CAMNT_0011641471 /DNA_START=859 /DNA_END=1183 /DNA_ORIENTATION=-